MTGDPRMTNVLLQAFASGTWAGVLNDKVFVLHTNPQRLIVIRRITFASALGRRGASKGAAAR